MPNPKPTAPKPEEPKVVPVVSEPSPEPLDPVVIAGIKSLLRLLPDAKRELGFLSANQWKEVEVAAQYLAGLVAPPVVPESQE
jgi:hypothetical protein